MKNQLIILFISLFIISTGYSQDHKFGKKMAIGFQVTQHQSDFGLGLNVSSPYFANQKIALRLRGNLMWYQHRDGYNTTWTPYSNISLGVIGVGGEVGNFMRLYGEGGVLIIFPSSKFSSKTDYIGGYGLFGFEFFMYPNGNYFLELGGVGTGAVADKLSFDPIFSNGFLINVGYRYQF